MGENEINDIKTRLTILETTSVMHDKDAVSRHAEIKSDLIIQQTEIKNQQIEIKNEIKNQQVEIKAELTTQLSETKTAFKEWNTEIRNSLKGIFEKLSSLPCDKREGITEADKKSAESIQKGNQNQFTAIWGILLIVLTSIAGLAFFKK